MCVFYIIYYKRSAWLSISNIYDCGANDLMIQGILLGSFHRNVYLVINLNVFDDDKRVFFIRKTKSSQYIHVFNFCF